MRPDLMRRGVAQVNHSPRLTTNPLQKGQTVEAAGIEPAKDSPGLKVLARVAVGVSVGVLAIAPAATALDDSVAARSSLAAGGRLASIANWSGTPDAVITEIPGTGYWGEAALGQPQIWLTHAAILDVEHGGGVGLFYLLHELRHTQQTWDGQQSTMPLECDADRWALSRLRATLQRFWPTLTVADVRRRIGDAVAWPGKYPCRGVGLNAPDP